MIVSIHHRTSRQRWYTRVLRFALVSMIAFPVVVKADCNVEEVGYIAIFDVKPAAASAFETAILKLVDTVNRVESGVILYAPFKGNDGKYYMMERYRDIATRDAHGSSEAVKALFPTLAPNLVSPPVVHAVSAVCPSAG